MPTYEYVCRDCGQHLEVVQSFTDAALSKCELCGGSLRKVFGSVGVVFKGSGFYKTDSRSSSGSSATRTAEAPSSEVKSEPAKKEDTAAKTETPAAGGESTAPKVAEKPAATSQVA